MDRFIFRHILGHFCQGKWNLRPVYERIRSVRYQKGKRNVITCITQKLSFLGLYVLLTGLWDFKDILNSRQDRSKNKLVRKNAVTRVHGSCSLQIRAPGYVCLFVCFFCESSIRLVNGNFCSSLLQGI